MGLLASVIGGLVGSDGSASFVGGVLSGLLGDGQTGGMGGQSGLVLFSSRVGLATSRSPGSATGPTNWFRRSSCRAASDRTQVQSMAGQAEMEPN